MAVSQGKFKNLYAFAVLRADGLVVTWGHSSYGGDASAVANQLTGVKSILSNYGAFAALKADGSVVTWGASVYGGSSSTAYYNGSYTYTSVADKLTSGVKSITSNSNAFAALKSDGSVVTWGDAKSGGASSIVIYNQGFSYISVADKLVGVDRLYSNENAFVALKKNGTVITWGGSDAGGDSSLVGSKLIKVKEIFATKQDFAALKSDGSVVAWGGTSAGDSSAVASQLINVKKVYANDVAFVALKKNGAVVTWGDDAGGGNSSKVKANLVNVKDIYASSSAFAALKTDGSVVTWGSSKTGGDSGLVNGSLAGVQIIYANNHAFAALKSDGSVVTWGNTFYGGDSSSVASKLIGVKAIYATDTAFAALKYDGTVVTWGSMAGGGDSSAVSRKLTGVLDIFSTGNDGSSAFAALKSDGSVVTWGDAYYGGNSSSVADALNGAIDVMKFNDQIGSSLSSSSNYGKVVAVFDADETLGAYAISTGKYVLSTKGLNVGAMPSINIELKDKTGKKDWQPVVGEFVVAIDESGGTTEVITSKYSSTTGTSYTQWIFDNSTGYATVLKPVVLTLPYILDKEVVLGQDINGDTAIGNVITQVFTAGDTLGLYQLATGSYIVADKGQEVGDKPFSMTELKLSKTALWKPATTSDSVIALDNTATGIELVIATAGKFKTTYSKVAFDLNTGLAGKKVIPTATQLSKYEETLGTDINGDGLVASLMTRMGDSVYELVITPTVWVTAKASADKSTYFDADSKSTIKGSLVSINTPAELESVLEFVTPFLSKLTAKAADGGNVPYLWTSGSDAVTEASWVWSDNNSISLTDPLWSSGKPETYSTNKQDYLGVSLANSADGSVLVGQWNDLLGTDKLAYIIEYTLA